MRRAFVAGSNLPVECDPEALETILLPSTEYEPEYDAFLKKKYAGIKVDLILAVSLYALEFAERHQDTLWPGTPVVFYSVSEEVVRDRELKPGFTGQAVAFDADGTVGLAMRLQPDARRVVIVGGVADADQYWVARWAESVRRYAGTMEMRFLTNLPLSQLVAEMRGIERDSIVLYATMFRDSVGQNYVPVDLVPKLTEASGAPVYSFFETSLGQGIVGGSVTSFEEQGHRAARLALRVLAGEKPETIPIQPSPPSVLIVDWRAMQRWGLRENLLPRGTELRFRVPSTWELHKRKIIGALALCAVEAVLIATLLVELRGRHRAEAKSRFAEETARTLSGRLIHAQEEERRRIARDLHDDLSQRLALLSVEMELLGRAESGEKYTAKLEQLTSRVRELSSDVHQLAYQLHPAKLDQLGLIAAARSFCRELSQQAGVKIDFTHDGVSSDLPPDVALCAFRAIQES